MEFIVWEDKYVTGIELLDMQHRKLFDLTNQLYEACQAGDEMLPAVFQDAMHQMVEYVRYHFSSELKLLTAINFPDSHTHKKMHDDLVYEILNAAKDYSEGKKLTPNNFVRILRDWILSHIAVYDKMYASYVADQKRRGKLTDQKLKEILRS